jgi:DNA invertase Pin-like site-specific DNA recombinase
MHRYSLLFSAEWSDLMGATLARVEPTCQRIKRAGGVLQISVCVGAFVELERFLIVKRVKAGMRRARLEGRRIGPAPLNVDRAAIVQDRIPV